MKKVAIILLSLLLLFSGCTSKGETISFFSMDTVMEITVYDHPASLPKAEAEINRLSALLDRKGGDVSTLNENGGGELSEELSMLLDTALFYWEETGGAFDPTLAQYSDLWGFYDSEYRVPTNGEIQNAVVGVQRVELTNSKLNLNGTCLDFGAIAKGYASDRAKAVLMEEGVTSAILSLGGNVMAIGEKPNGDPFTVAVTDPKNPSGYIGIVEIRDCAVVTSGDYQRYFEKEGKRYHHIIDPKTGFPVENNLSAVTVISKSGTEADALSTAFYVMGMEKACAYMKENEGVEAIFITRENKVYYTKGSNFCPNEGVSAEEISE